MIPEFKTDGLLPAYLFDPTSPAGHSPYSTTPTEMARTLGTSEGRILWMVHWLQHRKELRDLGCRGYQWINGSFVTDKEPPGDMDVVTLFDARNVKHGEILADHPHLFDKSQYQVDHFAVELMDINNIKECQVVNRVVNYWFRLWGHQKETNNQKGFLVVQLEDQDEAALL